MTSVTFPSSSVPLTGGRFPSIREGLGANNAANIGVSRSIKRSSSLTGNEFCKKRRKQTTPTRISNAEPEPNESTNSSISEGKPKISESPDRNVSCLVCQASFGDADHLQSHIITEHPPLMCKTEPDDHHSTTPALPYTDNSEPLSLSMVKTDMQWMKELQNKEWNVPNLQLNATNPLFMSLPQYTQPESIPMRSIRIFNPEAFCELCNKEFCNKYFLKTHKANKHGIFTETLPSEYSQLPVTVPSLASGSKLSNFVPTLESPTTKLDSKITMKTTHTPAMFLPNQEEVNLPEGELSENAITSNGLSSSSESEKTYVEDQTAGYRSPSNTQTESTSLKNEPDDFFHDTSSKLSSDQLNREFDLSYRLRRIGVMNPKAFCEICCKEYCNKYFLRTHKLKRHGICLPEDKERDFKSDMFNSTLPNNVQTSPLNLIMTEQNSIDCKTSSPSEISCEACGIRFQNASLAHLHNVSVHNKIIKDEFDKNKKNPDKSTNPEVINDDLRKLQTMILQLNELETIKTVSVCNVCNKDFENRFYLDAHMMSAHGLLLDNTVDSERTAEPETMSNNNTMCDICGREVKSSEEMTKHIMEFHSSGTGNEATKEEHLVEEKSLLNRVPNTDGHPTDRRVSLNVTPTSSYCEICNKELCNKYFMKTHMQRMHGIEIENGAQIGGVVCDICNKELCSKYFLRVHKHNTHGIMEYGSNLFTPRKTECDTSTTQQFPPPAEPDPALKPGDLADLSHKYFYHFTEVCAICSRRFRSTKWLKAHLISDHGQLGTEKWKEIEQQSQGRNFSRLSTIPNNDGISSGMKVSNGTSGPEYKEGMQHFLSNILGVDDNNARLYQCSSCSFTTPLLPLLFIHEKSHFTDAENLKCPICMQNFNDRDHLQRHLLKKHPFLLQSTFGDKNNQDEDTIKSSVADCTIKEGGRELEKVESEDVRSTTPLEELPPEIGESLKDVATKMRWPATYAIPRSKSGSGDDKDQEEAQVTSPGYIMQAFLLEESTTQRRVVPSVVFLPMLQKQVTPITITFTLTPA